jgi:hypothetical protein
MASGAVRVVGRSVRRALIVIRSTQPDACTPDFTRGRDKSLSKSKATMSGCASCLLAVSERLTASPLTTLPGTST